MSQNAVTVWVIRLATKCLAIFYLLCTWILPKRRQILFLSRQSDSEPLDFALLRKEIANRNSGYRTVALCKQLRNQLAYLPHLLKQVVCLATSSAVVLDSYSLAVSLLADNLKIPVLQIWHGVGNMKKFGYTALDTAEGNSREIAELMRMHAGYDSVLVSSLSFASDFAKGLGVSEDLLFECPLPRCDVLVDRTGQTRDREFLHKLSGGRPVVVYAPTFRRPLDAKDSSNSSASIADTPALAMSSLFAALLERGFAVAYRPHPVANSNKSAAKSPATQDTDKESSNQATLDLDETLANSPYLLTDFSDCPPGFNLVRAADALISDYSTIIYEAGLAGVPVYLYGYDWEQYRQRRGLYIDPSRDIPTVFSQDPQVIADAILHNACKMERFSDFVRQNVSLPRSSTCAARAVDHLFELIRKGKTSSKYWRK